MYSYSFCNYVLTWWTYHSSTGSNLKSPICMWTVGEVCCWQSHIGMIALFLGPSFTKILGRNYSWTWKRQIFTRVICRVNPFQNFRFFWKMAPGLRCSGMYMFYYTVSPSCMQHLLWYKSGSGWENTFKISGLHFFWETGPSVLYRIAGCISHPIFVVKSWIIVWDCYYWYNLF